MRKIVFLVLSVFLLVVCVRCASNVSNTDSGGKYTLNVSYGLGGDTGQTKLSFDASIGGKQSDIENIAAYEVLINEEYLDLLLENGPYSSKDMGDYIQITGTIVFDNIGMTKNEIDAIELFEGFKIIDKDGAEFELYIPRDNFR